MDFAHAVHRAYIHIISDWGAKPDLPAIFIAGGSAHRDYSFRRAILGVRWVSDIVSYPCGPMRLPNNNDLLDTCLYVRYGPCLSSTSHVEKV
jgi:hypothetical protein